MAKPQFLYPLNDLTYRTLLEDIDNETGAVVPVTEGEVTAYIGKTDDATTPAEETLVATCTHIGVESPTEDQYPQGTWLIEIDRDVLTFAVLEPLFGDGASTQYKPYLIVDDPAGARVVLPLKYSKTRTALVGS